MHTSSQHGIAKHRAYNVQYVSQRSTPLRADALVYVVSCTTHGLHHAGIENVPIYVPAIQNVPIYVPAIRRKEIKRTSCS